MAKYVHTHFGDTKVDRYSIGEAPVPVVWSPKSLGVALSHGVKTTAHCHEVATKRCGALWALSRTLTKLDTSIFTTVYTTSVRSELDNRSQAASSCLNGVSDILENVRSEASVQFQKSGVYHTN